MHAKPLPPNKTKERIESFLRNYKDLDVYEVKKLSPTDLRDSTKEEQAWLIIRPSLR